MVIFMKARLTQHQFEASQKLLHTCHPAVGLCELKEAPSLLNYSLSGLKSFHTSKGLRNIQHLKKQCRRFLYDVS